MADELDSVRTLTEQRRQAQQEAERLDGEWRKAIVAALRGGQAATRIAEVAGIGRARVYQIRDGKR